MYMSPEKLLISSSARGYELTVKKSSLSPASLRATSALPLSDKAASRQSPSSAPVRPENQVEISLTDARSIGVTAPVRESGDVAGSGACKLVGPKGEIELECGVIAAQRHIHATPEDAENTVFRTSR